MPDEEHPRIEPFASFGDWVDSERLRLGLLKKELAERCGLSVSWLNTVIAGGRRDTKDGPWNLPSPSTAKLIKLADGLNIPRAEVFEKLGRVYTGPNARPPAPASSGIVLELDLDEADAMLTIFESLIETSEDPAVVVQARGLHAAMLDALARQSDSGAVLARHPSRGAS